MTLPASVVSVELRGAYIRADGSPPKGRVVFTPVARTDSPSLNLTVVAVPVTVPVDDTGRFTVRLAAGNQSAFEAPLYLHVEEYLDKTLRSYTILVPESAAAAGLDLADAETLEPVVDMAGYVLLSSVGVAVAPLVDGLVPAVHLPLGLEGGLSGSGVLSAPAMADGIFAVTVTSNFGLTSAGAAYYDPDGATPSDAAIASLDSSGSLVLTRPGG